MISISLRQGARSVVLYMCEIINGLFLECVQEHFEGVLLESVENWHTEGWEIGSAHRLGAYRAFCPYTYEQHEFTEKFCARKIFPWR
jgi:hypothetical protein